MSERFRYAHARVAAVALAASLVGAAADWLPVAFHYTPNELGIVSRTTMARYPAHQEVFWLVFGVGGAGVLAWILARALAPIAQRPRLGVALEAVGAACLASFLWLPRGQSSILVLAGLVVAWWLARRSPARVARPAPREPAARTWPRPARVALAAALLAAATVYSVHPMFPDGFWGGLAHVARATPDAALASDDPFFQIEWGEHLAWADRLRTGQLPGRDFFCLYGPLYEYSLLAAWGAVGRSVAAVALWQGAVYAMGAACLLALGVALFRLPVLLLVFPFFVTTVSLRIGLGLAGIAALVLWRRRDDARWCAAAGLAGGIGLVFSQEFGLAFALVGTLAVALDARARPLLTYLGALACVPAATAIGFASQGALGPVLSDLVAYPGYVAAGYANVPIRPLLDGLPLRLVTTPATWQLSLHLPYALPAVCTGALLLALPLEALELRRPRKAAARLRDALLADPARLGVAALALFGLLAFRSALGRSDLFHLAAVGAPAALLLGVGLDRAIHGLQRPGSARVLAAWRIGLLFAVALQSGLLAAADPAPALSSARRGLAHLAGSPPPARGSERVAWLAAWLREHSGPGDPVLLLPNLAGSAYLADRRNPTRFVLSAMIVTDAHRDEVLRDLRANPPRFIVWDHHAMRVDALGDRQVLGADTVAWIDAHYEVRLAHDDYEIRARRTEP